MSTQSDQSVEHSPMWGAKPGVKSADYGTRAVAYIIDTAVIWGLSIAMVVVAVLVAQVSDNVWVFLIPLVLIWAGYLVWWVMLLRRSQTPGKMIMKIWVIRDGGMRAGWGLMLVRELLVKGLVFVLILGPPTFYVVTLVDLLWPIWDRNNQTLHDKIMGTHAVQGPMQE